MYLLNGRRLFVGEPFSHEDNNYPANWLELSMLEDRMEIGVLEVEDPPVIDTRVSYPDGSPKDVNELKQEIGAEIKRVTSSMLQSTDWYIIRKIERGIDIPDDVVARRAAILVECARLEAWLDLCQDHIQVQAYLDGEKWKDL